jgi:hypothetical protein
LTSEATRPRDPDRDLNNELFSAKLEATFNAPVRDLNNELFSAKLEVRVKAPIRDLKREDLSTKPEAIAQVEVRMVEHERGLELQISFPESTLATMLPVVIVTEAVSVLRIEFFSARPEARFTAAVRARV